MKTIIKSINIRDFKGIKQLTLDLSGDATITAPTGQAKSTIEDAWQWLRDGKNAAGDTKFTIIPTNAEGKSVPNPKPEVIALIDIDGTVHTIERALIVSSRSTKTTTKIDAEPLSVNDYEARLIQWFGDNYSLLSGLHTFSKLHWTEQRQKLIDMVGDVTVNGFDGLAADMGEKSLDGYTATVKAMLKEHSNELDKIPTRIEELNRTVPESIESKQGLTAKREAAEKLKVEIETAINELDKEEVEIRKSINDLKDKLADRERELKAIDPASKKQEEINKLNTVVNNAKQRQIQCRNKVNTAKQELAIAESELSNLQAKLAGYRDIILSVNNATIGNCPTCNQPYPADKKAELMQEVTSKRQDAIKNGNKVKSQIDIVVQMVERLKEVLSNAENELKKTDEEVAMIISSCDSKLAELENNDIEPLNFASDQQYRNISFEIAEMEFAKDKNDAKATELRQEHLQAKSGLEELDRQLKGFDTIQKNLDRIKELREEEVKLSQAVATLKGKIDQIEKYKLAMSIELEKAVANKFKYTKFKLTQTNKSGDIDDWCSASLDGIPYSDCSTGQKMQIGIDIVNTLSAHYDCYMPLFIDEAQSLTLPIETESQLIRLVAGNLLDDKELALTKKTKKVKFTAVGGFVKYLNVQNME